MGGRCPRSLSSSTGHKCSISSHDAERAVAGPLLAQGSLVSTDRCADVLWVQEPGCT